MSRDKTRAAVTSECQEPAGAKFRSDKEAQELAQQIVDIIGKDSLVDIKFLIDSSSSATREEILAAALAWVKSAEEKFAKQALLPL